MLKWAGITLAVAVGLFLLVCSLIVWILTPGRLTPLVGKYASEYLDADVSASRVELTFWKTFPRMRLEVDSLEIVSRSLRGYKGEIQVADADSLLSIRSFSGSVNVVKLLAGEIALHDVTIDRPAVNLVQVNDSVANYDIFPTSEEADTASSVFVPKISINSFRILQAGPLRYRSLADSLDVSARLENASVEGTAAPRYRLRMDGVADLPLSLIHI